MEKSFKGTKGPWCKSKDLIHDQTYLARHIVRIIPDSMPAEEIEANAHLIASAPDLLEACIEALGFLEAIGTGALVQVQLEAAISKALNTTSNE